MLKLDKKFIQYLQENNIQKIKVFFYKAGCSGTKVNITFDDFEENGLILLNQQESKDFSIFVPLEEKKYFENATITRTVRADHTGKEKVRYIFVNDSVKERCGCGSSFSFEKKKPTINIGKLQDWKKRFGE